MAFSDRYKTSAGEQCPVCRQIFTDGRKIREASYGRNGSSQILCQKCYKRYYTNSSAKRNIGIRDDTDNPFVRFRPAESLENDKIFKKERPSIGYEFRLSYLLMEQTLHDVLFWYLTCLLMRLFLYLVYVDKMDASIGWMVLKYFTLIGSAVGIFTYVRHLFSAIVNGVGLTRKLVLCAAIACLFVMILITI